MSFPLSGPALFCFAAAGLALLGGAGGAACTPSHEVSTATPIPTSQAAILLRPLEHFTDTVYLSDFAQRAPADATGGPSRASLPTLVNLRGCQFDGPVLAGRPGETVFGGLIDFTGASFRAGVDLRGLRLSHDLLLARTTSASLVRLSGIRIAGLIDLSHASFGESLQLDNAQVFALTARRLNVAAGVNLQRLHVTESLAFIEAELRGYVDATYLRCLGDAFFDHVVNDDRVVLDYAAINGRLSLANVKWPAASLRHLAVAGPIDGLTPDVLATANLEGTPHSR